MRALTILALAFLAAVLFYVVSAVLLVYQTRGEAPAYTCDPGSIYTTAECQ